MFLVYPLHSSAASKTGVNASKMADEYPKVLVLGWWDACAETPRCSLGVKDGVREKKGGKEVWREREIYWSSSVKLPFI